MKTLVVSTCTARKTNARGCPDLSTVPQLGDPVERQKLWVAEVARIGSPLQSPESLYQGDHWQATLQAWNAAKAWGESELWVISAGLGLIPVRPEIVVPAYNASFSLGSRESIIAGVPAYQREIYAQMWWEQFRTLSPVVGDFPRSLAELARQQSRNSLIVLIASEPYLIAIKRDLQEMIQLWPDGNRLIIVSSGASQRMQAGFGDWMLNVDIRFLSVVGGAAGALNARTAAWMFANTAQGSWTRAHVDAQIMQALKLAPPLPPRPVRNRLHPSDIVKFIELEMRKEPAAVSVLHRRLRNKGWACEQKRFYDYYRLIVEGIPFTPERVIRERQAGFECNH